jgi:hypothetical protein
MLIDNGKLIEVKKTKSKVSPMTFAEWQVGIWEKRFEKKELSKVTFQGYLHRVNVINRYLGAYFRHPY